MCPLPDIEDIEDDDLDRAEEALSQSIETRHREIRNHPRGNPNGDDEDRRNYRLYRQHADRITEEQDLLRQVRQRIRERDTRMQ